MTQHLDTIIKDLEQSSGGMEFHAVARRFETALVAIGDAEHPDKTPLRAECIAFSFSEGSDDRGNRPTYFRPQFSARDENGVEHDFPPLTSVQPDTIAYWSDRARTTENPFLQTRYSDLVWDLSMPAIGQRPDVFFARMAADSSLGAVKMGLFKYEFVAILRLKRALDLCLSVRDANRAKEAIALMIAYEDQIAKDHLAGLWGFSFDALLLDSKVPIENDQRTKLIRDMEARLDRMAHVSFPDPPSIEPAVDRLATHYRRTTALEDERRVVRTFAEAVQRFAERGPILAASSWLDKVHERLVHQGMNEDADRIALKMREIEAKIPGTFRGTSTVVSIPRAELDAELADILDGPIDEVFLRFGATFVVNADEVGGQLKKMAQEHPLLGMFGVVVHDNDGRKVASTGSVENDFDGRIALEMGRRLQSQAPFLRYFLASFAAKHPLSAETIVAFLGSDSIFLTSRHHIIKRGLEAYSTGDPHVALCVLLPEIESGLRRLLHLRGGSVYKRARSGGTNLRNLDEILRDEAVVTVLTSPVARYLQIVLTDSRGWNVRNEICHGLVAPEEVAQPFADRILHVLVLLGCVRLTPVAAADGCPTGSHDAAGGS